MVAGADLVRYLLSAGGVILLLLVAAIWIAISTTSRAARRFLIVTAVAVSVVSVYGVEYLIARVIAVGFKPFKVSDVIAGRRTALIVLGSGSMEVEDWDGRTFAVPDHAAASRVLEATRIFKLLDPAIVISSGGNSHGDSPVKPTGETMRDAMVTLGIPFDRIMVETASQTTRDEATVIGPILQTQHAEQVVLVTSQTHMRRALGTFRAAGINAIPAVAQEFDNRQRELSEWLLPSDEGLFVASNNAHELIGFAYYWFKGWWKR
jgi:uncharacterized SAM-binding protein YcdF (DUF218 family)